jgi:hypothetical protein
MRLPPERRRSDQSRASGEPRASRITGARQVDRRLAGSKPQYNLMKHLETDSSWVSHHSGPTSSRAVSVVGASVVSDSDQDLGLSVR